MKSVFDVAAQFARPRWTAFFRALALVLVATTLVLAGVARAADPGAPERTVTQFNNALIHAMQESKHLGYQGRFDTLAAAMSATFDFEAMTRVAVGPRWVTMTADQQKAIVAAFKRFSVAMYADQFDSYAGERFELSGLSNPPQGTLVNTVLTAPGGDVTKFGYLLHQVNGNWRIIDIYLDGTISQLAVRRSEFASVLARSGPDGLLRLLDEKAEKLAMM